MLRISSEEYRRRLESLQASGLSEVQITILTPFPGTELYSRLRSERRLLRPVFWESCTLFDVTCRPKQMSPGELEGGFRELMRDLYSPKQSARRKEIRKECYGRQRTGAMA